MAKPLANPLIICPGFGGSELSTRFSLFLTDSPVWMSIVRLAAGGLEGMTLAPDGLSPASFFYPALKPGTVMPEYYGDLVGFLMGLGYDVQSAYEDWRLPLAVRAPFLAAHIRAVATIAPVTLVCHSRGGLLAAAAAHLLAATGELGMIAEGISLGTPWRGSYAPVGYLAGWGDTMSNIQVALATSAIFTGPMSLMRNIRGVTITWPALYELLVDPVAAAAQGDANVAAAWNPFLYAAAGVPIYAQHMEAARERWLTSPGLPAGLKWTHIVGNGIPCEGPVRGTHTVDSSQYLARELPGDGTVPIWSATALGGNVVEVGVGHSDLPKSDIVQGILRGMLA